MLTPGKMFAGSECGEFFVSLDEDRKNLRDELRFVFDTASGLLPYPIHLHKTSLKESLASVGREAEAQVGRKIGITEPDIAARLVADMSGPLALTLYLASQTAEIPGIVTRPAPNYHPRKRRLFPPAKPRAWEVGFRLGAALRHATSSAAADECTGIHRAAVRPHIRRAHWHGYSLPRKIGRQSSSKERKLTAFCARFARPWSYLITVFGS